MRLADLVPTIMQTWPPVRQAVVGPFTVPVGAGGGNRVSAARLSDPYAADAEPAEINAAAAGAVALDQGQVFMVLDHQGALDTHLSEAGFVARDETLCLVMPCSALARQAAPDNCLLSWPPLAIQAEIWAEGNIGPARLAVMERSVAPKVSLLGRCRNRPAGTAFVACHGSVAMLHALEVTAHARRSGLGRSMMGNAAAWALKRGAETFSVLVTRDNMPARGLYASLGFEPVGSYHYRFRNA